MDLTAAHDLATRLLAEHGLTDWRVEYDAAKRRAGVCRFATRTIGLSAPLTVLHDEAMVRDTVLHEIAHALVGPSHGHDATWARTARAIGCSAERCVPADAPRVAAPWLGVCPAGHTVDRHRRPERVLVCRRCSGSTFDLRHVLTWTHHGRPAAHHPNYVAELAALRDGRRVTRLGVGSQARITVPGEYHRSVGTVLKRGRTCYHLRVGRLVLRVPFAGVEPA